MGKSNSRYRSLTFIPSILVKSTRLPSRASALGHKRPLNSLAVEGLLSANSGHFQFHFTATLLFELLVFLANNLLSYCSFLFRMTHYSSAQF